MGADRPSEVVITFSEVRSARFRMLWDQAPQTCSALAGALPYSGDASHATCSGPAAVVFLESELPVPPENVTVSPAPGQLLYTYYAPGWRQGYPEHTSEIYWFHGEGGRPTVPGMFIPAMASVFAEHVGDAAELDAFSSWSRLLHREGFKPCTVDVR